uniref:cytosolic endo-beta-N-acetylglucosaminidase isoform X2 n=1 Tax=Myxine glutinosa TaxID=7769 RepID=UPI00358FE564
MIAKLHVEKDLTLEKAVEIARGIETAERTAAVAQSPASGVDNGKEWQPEPVAGPLHSLKELLDWRQDDVDPLLIAFIPIASRRPELSRAGPRTLLCHDMKGGYQEDRFVQGLSTNDPYTFYHWQQLDLFVYFSHHFVSIPPPGWINAAHRHGVAVLGTLITESKGGQQFCREMLTTQEMLHKAAEQLVLIATVYGFDGWFLNIENDVPVELMDNLVEFVRYLTERVHAILPQAQVIWYDSVLRGGKLNWQNELNQENKVFLESCDGFFVNYNWTREGLRRTRELAGDRWNDVYVGVDVFGRNCPGGGGWSTHVAIAMIREVGLSTAIFAPGWVHEVLGTEDFHENQLRFWNFIDEYLPTHSISTLPLVTTFCQGHGKHLYFNGEIEKTGPWHNLSAQQVQPLYVDTRPEASDRPSDRTTACGEKNATEATDIVAGGTSHMPPQTHGPGATAERGARGKDRDDDSTATELESIFRGMKIPGRVQHVENDGSWVRLRSCSDDAFTGGCSLLMEGQLGRDTRHLAAKLLRLSVPAPDTTLLMYVYKVDQGTGVTLGLNVTTLDDDICRLESVFTLQGVTHWPTSLDNGDKIGQDLLDKCGGKVGNNWTLRCYQLRVQNCTLQDIFLTANKEKGSHGGNFRFRVGELKVLNAESLREPLPTISRVNVRDVSWSEERVQGFAPRLLLSAKLHWSLGRQAVSCFRVLCRAGESPPTLLGHAYAPAFHVLDLEVPMPASSNSLMLEFLVQPVSLEGFVGSLDGAVRYTLDYCSPNQNTCIIQG